MNNTAYCENCATEVPLDDKGNCGCCGCKVDVTDHIATDKPTKTYLFSVKVEVREKDDCGNRINPPTVGEVYRAVSKGLDYAEKVDVELK